MAAAKLQASGNGAVQQKQFIEPDQKTKVAQFEEDNTVFHN